MQHPVSEDRRTGLMHFNRITALVLIAAALALVVYKALCLPVTHDESYTAVHYTGFSWLEIIRAPDPSPNNHILNTLITKLLMSHLGISQWVIRIPAIVSFLLYSFALFRISRALLTTRSLFFVPAVILFLCNPYLLDFFSLCRGYGMSTALVTLSAGYLVTGFMNRRTRDVWIAFSSALLAAYANFTSLVFLAAVIGFSILFFLLQFRKRRKTSVISLTGLLIICAAFVLLIMGPILKMQETDQFHHWKTHGFYVSTLLESVIAMFYGSDRFAYGFYQALSVGVILVTAAAFLTGIFRYLRSGRDPKSIGNPALISSGLLLATVLVNILQCALLGTPNLNGRTALFFFPLFIMCAVALAARFRGSGHRVRKVLFSVLVSATLLLQFADTVNLRMFREWWFDAHTFEVIRYLDEERKGETVTLKTNWIFMPSFFFYQMSGDMPGILLKEYDRNIDFNTNADYYFVLAEDCIRLKPKFKEVLKVDDRCRLMKDTE